MQIQYLGHAGCLIREDDILIAYDPFLSGEFLWNGKINVYKGDSPWIGSHERIERFSKEFGPKLKAILISHAHMDHFDPYTINALMAINPDIEILAPYPVIEWLRASSILIPASTQFLTPITWDGKYEVEGMNSKVEIIVMPNSKVKKELQPYRVGYLIKQTRGKGEEKGAEKRLEKGVEKGANGLFLVGDSAVSDHWESHRTEVTHLFTWGKAIHSGIIDYFNGYSNIKHIWINHWEAFTPGNFDCNQDPNEFIKIARNQGIQASSLPYNEWINIE